MKKPRPEPLIFHYDHLGSMRNPALEVLRAAGFMESNGKPRAASLILDHSPITAVEIAQHIRDNFTLPISAQMVGKPEKPNGLYLTHLDLGPDEEGGLVVMSDNPKSVMAIEFAVKLLDRQGLCPACHIEGMTGIRIDGILPVNACALHQANPETGAGL